MGKCAVAILTNTSDIQIEGTIVFTEYDSNDELSKKGLEIKINVKGISPGLHGIHVHEYGDLRNGCKSLCNHFNPYKSLTHGGPDDNHTKKHLGDLGNIKVNSTGTCKCKIYIKKLKIDGIYGVVGRSIIIHEKEDDLGKGGNKESIKTGNAGNRIACGVIGYAPFKKNIKKNKHESDEMCIKF